MFTTLKLRYDMEISTRNPNLIGGRFVDSQSSTSIDVVNPETKRAFPLWRHTPVTTRQQIMFKLQELIQRDIDKLAFAIATSKFKWYGFVFPEIVECVYGGAVLQTGEFVSNMSNGIDTFSIREPLGVCAGICMFTFPAMIPLWVWAIWQVVKERISKLIQAYVDSGAKLDLDGRQIAVSKYELGNFIGPTILSDITEDIECSKEEILGPILLCMQKILLWNIYLHGLRGTCEEIPD
ncbi:hypothetical protein K7X08_008990 [Anisodus acutangulus]|uniref:Aldehyde dehydrogenase domain-containing protein n=1 Tax=Anisodus acutangulus TaxID=402998 RepID=A0A9Q1RT27_9SOLA|nr:hypothetical protein K7X08_008990 [Anisodus acutangulus]